MSDSAVIAGTDGFTPLRVEEVVPETHDTISLVLEVPGSQRDRFQYNAGQYLTVRVTVADAEHQRCYSMSSSPAINDNPRITIKRERDGLVSNWLHDNVTAGAVLDVAAPQGRFVLTESDRPLVAFAGGSGITPVFSLLRTALVGTDRNLRLLYANRDRRSVIFAPELDELAEHHSGRLAVHHHIDQEKGILSAAAITEFAATAGDADYYICGPAPFMDAVETVLGTQVVDPARIHLERFRSVVPDIDAADPVTEKVIVEIGRKTAAVEYRAGSTLLQTARSAGLQPPSSCETGSCGTCIARVTEGSVRLLNNDVLTDEELADGYTLTCQSIPLGPTVRVIYE
ncbi:ferredoxin--NADP reductase [Nocardia alni]|uniref:ferredoxin--NADP reductase n=1 Tax=Nocardia alni TaxID=2815723 RepID=UPI001C22BFA7|nr:ferredoxin--NADP reductase [Nocardia alni]